jgi:regulatory protein
MKRAMDIALAVLARRPVTCHEIKKRLQDKKIAAEEISQTVSKLTEWGYLDDYRLTMEYCQTRSRRHSRLKIRKDLLQRGLDKVLVDEVLVNFYTQEQELQLCLHLAQQIIEREKQHCARLPRDKAGSRVFPNITPYQKAGAKLARLGYPYEMISKALSSLVNGEIVT